MGGKITYELIEELPPDAKQVPGYFNWATPRGEVFGLPIRNESALGYYTVLVPKYNTKKYTLEALEWRENKITVTEQRSLQWILATTFVPNPTNSSYVGFKDKDRTNLLIDNLYWIEKETGKKEKQFKPPKRPKPELHQDKRPKCEICGKPLYDTYTFGEYKTLCNKHYNQFVEYGKPLDVSPLDNICNDYHILGQIVIFQLYNKDLEPTKKFAIHIRDFDKVRRYYWRDEDNEIVTGSFKDDTYLTLAQLIMDLPPFDGTYCYEYINKNHYHAFFQNIRVYYEEESEICFIVPKFPGIEYDDKKQVYRGTVRYKGKAHKLKSEHNHKWTVYKMYYIKTIIPQTRSYNPEEMEKMRQYTLDVPQDVKTKLEEEIHNKIQEWENKLNDGI